MNVLQLSLGELRSATCLFETVLLSFLDARVACEEAFLLECGTAIGLCLKESARNAETDCVSLTGVTAAVDVYEYVVLAFYAEKSKGLLNNILQN